VNDRSTHKGQKQVNFLSPKHVNILGMTQVLISEDREAVVGLSSIEDGSRQRGGRCLAAQ